MLLCNLQGIIPPDILEELMVIIGKYDINTPLRVSHFLAQCSHESTDFTRFIENLNYSAKGLVDTFPKYFPTLIFAKSFERNPEKIANFAYANRMGNILPTDGWTYKGRGAIQLTGKENYINFDKEVSENIVGFPDLVATKYKLTSAAWFWNKNNLSKLADEGDSERVIKNVTRRINGGLTHIEDRIKKFNKFYNILK